MPSSSRYPMDEIVVRRLRFAPLQRDQQSPVWSRTSLLFAIFANAFGIHVPHFERYLVRTLTLARSAITDRGLVSDVDAIIGQEAQHAQAFFTVNAWLGECYPAVAHCDMLAAQSFAARTKSETFKRKVGYVAGYETFTFLAGMAFLDNYERWFADSDGTMKAMWLWHQVEEVEHAAVAFDVYQHFFADDEAYRRWMVLVAGYEIFRETMKAYFAMCRAEDWLGSPSKALKSFAFFVSMMLRTAWNVRPVFARRYHPRRHPLATSRQNPIAIAWRTHFRDGGDVLSVDRLAVARMLERSATH
jgi:uncharacterized protein